MPPKVRPGATTYLFGAQELRQGMPKAPPRPPMPRETLAALRTEQLWDVLGIRLNGPKAQGKRIVLNWRFTDTNESFILNLENCALTYVAGSEAAMRMPASPWRAARSTR